MEIVLKIGLVVLLVLLNAFFVASEFALVSVRKTRIQELAKKGNSRAKLLLKSLEDLDHYISATQFGITIASLALGWVGEPAIAHFFETYMVFLPAQISVLTAHTIAIIIGFSIITFLHIVIGELAPKSIALQKSEKISLTIIAPLVIFTKVFNPFIWFLNKSGQSTLRLLGINPTGEDRSFHSEEEVKMILTESGESGVIPEDEVEMVYNVFQFGDIQVKEVMVPRNQILAFNSSTTLKEVAEKIENHPHSRFPVYEKSIDKIIGFVHIKDIYRQILDDGDSKLLNDIKLIRKVINVPEKAKLDKLMEEMQKKRVHLAVVQDLNKNTSGIITLEDLIESLVGEIEDEFN